MFEAHQKPASAKEQKKDATQHHSTLKASDVENKGDAPKQHVGKVEEENIEEGKKSEAEENEVKEDKTSEANENNVHKNLAGEKKKGDDAKMENEHEKETSEGENDSNDAETKPRIGVKKAMGKQGQENVRGFKLARHPSCVDDVKQLCSALPKENNFAILVCLQDSATVSYMTSFLFYQFQS